MASFIEWALAQIGGERRAAQLWNRNSYTVFKDNFRLKMFLGEDHQIEQNFFFV
jgi:hypothetical protein